MPPQTVPGHLIVLLGQLQKAAEQDSNSANTMVPVYHKLEEARDLLLGIFRGILIQLDTSLTSLQRNPQVHLKPLTYDEYKEYRKKILDAKKALAYTKLTYDDYLIKLKNTLAQATKEHKDFIRLTKKNADFTISLLDQHKPEKPAPPPPTPKPIPPFILQGPWLCQLRNFGIKYYTHIKVSEKVKPILYRRGFELLSHWNPDKRVREFYGEDYPGPFHPKDKRDTYKSFWKYGAKDKEPYVVTGVPYFWQTYYFEICIFTETLAKAIGFTFKLGKEHPTTFIPLQPMKYPAVPITPVGTWRDVNKDDWLTKAEEGTL